MPSLHAKCPWYLREDTSSFWLVGIHTYHASAGAGCLLLCMVYAVHGAGCCWINGSAAAVDDTLSHRRGEVTAVRPSRRWGCSEQTIFDRVLPCVWACLTPTHRMAAFINACPFQEPSSVLLLFDDDGGATTAHVSAAAARGVVWYYCACIHAV